MSFLEVQMRLGEMQMFLSIWSKIIKETILLSNFSANKQVLNFISFLYIYEEIPLQDNFPTVA